MEKQYFIEISSSQVEDDLYRWLNQYDDVAEYQREGYRFLFVTDSITRKIVLYVQKTFQCADGVLHVIELSALKIFKSIEDAQANWNGVVEYYIADEINKDIDGR